MNQLKPNPKMGSLITPTPGSRYYTSPQANQKKRLNRTTILQNLSQSVRNNTQTSPLNFIHVQEY